MNNSQVIYKNTITMRNGSTEVITRDEQVVIDFSCYYTKPETKSVTFKIRDRWVCGGGRRFTCSLMCCLKLVY